MNGAVDTFLSLAGLFLIFMFLSEDFHRGLQHLKTLLAPRPRWKLFAYPLGALLVLGATALILHTLTNFAAIRFSYE